MISTVSLFGLGARVPEETTLETLMELADCPAAFAALPPGRSWRWLRKHCPGLRRATSPETVIAAARRSGAAGVAVPGNALFSGTFAARLLEACRRKKIAVRVYGALSPIGDVFARAVCFLGDEYGYQGIQSFSLERLLGEPSAYSPRLPLVVYADRARREDWRRLGAALARRLPPDHPAHVYPSDRPLGALATAGTLGRAMRAGGVVLIPPAPGRAPRDVL
jgi:hypothetical protein